MSQDGDATSVAPTTTSRYSSKSSSSALSRAFLFQLHTHSVQYNPPKLPKDLEDVVTFACGQLEADENGDTGAAPPAHDEDQDDETLAAPVLFRGYIEFTQQVTPRRIREWVFLGTAADLEIRPAYLKDREQHIRLRTDPERRFKSKIDVILRPAWQIGKSDRAPPGARTDFETIREILRDHGPEEGIRRVAEEFPGQFMRYASGITQLAQAVIPRVREAADFKFRPWQAAIVKICQGKAHSRHIYWIEDPRGAAGKSRLTTYMCREMGAVELDGRQMDAAFSYTGQRIVLFDLARAVEAPTLKDLYIVGEKLKNGQIYSSKYQSRLKVFEVPHVIYFSNSPPPIGVWSADRLQHILLSEHVPFSTESQALDGTAAEPEVTGVDMFKEFLEAETARGTKRDREGDE